MPASSHKIDAIDVTFDHRQAVADAGLLLTGTLIDRLGLKPLADEAVTVGFRPGRKLLTLVHTLVAGGDCIDDVNLLRAGSTSSVLGHDTVAASTVGTWLRGFTFRQRPPARQGRRTGADGRVGSRRGARRRSDVHRHRLHDL